MKNTDSLHILTSGYYWGGQQADMLSERRCYYSLELITLEHLSSYHGAATATYVPTGGATTLGAQLGGAMHNEMDDA